MSISANYAQPVFVNGYACWNCHQVSEAKKDINPAQPADGASSAATPAGAVLFGGSLSNAVSALAQPSPKPPQASATGGALDLYA